MYIYIFRHAARVKEKLVSDKSYTLMSSNLKFSIYSYLIPDKSFGQYSGNLSVEEYVKNFNWVSTWLNRNFIEFSEHAIAILIPMLILVIFDIIYFL